MRPVWNRLAKLLFASAMAAVAATLVVAQVRGAEGARRGQADVARMTKDVKTLCSGRFLIDLPQETRPELRGPRIDGFDISSVDGPEADFQVRRAQRNFVFKMTAGEGERGPVPSSLSQGAAMALRDNITPNIRVHAPGPAKPTHPVPPASASARASRAPDA